MGKISKLRLAADSDKPRLQEGVNAEELAVLFDEQEARPAGRGQKKETPTKKGLQPDRL